MRRAAELAVQGPEERWLIRRMWSREAVGIIGGAPKCGKSWLGLDMAVSVASGTPCLGRFDVDDVGPTLVYLAEDALPMVRARVDAICEHRRLSIDKLELHVIDVPALRLDLATDQKRLAAAIERLEPRLLVLDPLVRLHRLDENSASDISKLLGYLRELQRAYELAVVLVHHASKKHRAQPGQALRGSSDLHAFGDCNAYLARKREQLILTLEHRAARPPEPLTLELRSASDGSRTHLEVVSAPDQGDAQRTLHERILDHLTAVREPQSRQALRTALRVNNNRLGEALVDLERRDKLLRTAQGWTQNPDSTPQQSALFP